MKTLQDVINYAEEQGIYGYRLERLIDEIDDEMTEEIFEVICCGIDCEVEEN